MFREAKNKFLLIMFPAYFAHDRVWYGTKELEGLDLKRAGSHACAPALNAQAVFTPSFISLAHSRVVSEIIAYLIGLFFCALM